MGSAREFLQILGYGIHRSVGWALVKLVSVSGPVEAVKPEKSCFGRERASRIILYEPAEIGLGSIVILEPVVAQPPVILHRVVSFSAAREDRQRLEKGSRLGIFPFIEIPERRFILHIGVIAVQQGLVLRLARHGKQQYSSCNDKLVDIHLVNTVSVN